MLNLPGHRAIGIRMPRIHELFYSCICGSFFIAMSPARGVAEKHLLKNKVDMKKVRTPGPHTLPASTLQNCSGGTIDG